MLLKTLATDFGNSTCLCTGLFFKQIQNFVLFHISKQINQFSFYKYFRRVTLNKFRRFT